MTEPSGYDLEKLWEDEKYPSMRRSLTRSDEANASGLQNGPGRHYISISPGDE